MLRLTAIMFACLALIGSAAYAEPAKVDDAAERLSLSKELHDIRHIRDSIHSDIEGYAEQLPQNDREDFMRYVALKIDFNKLEQASIRYAAEVYSVPELKVMIAYYGQADAQSAESKGPLYAAKISADVRKEIDAAIMAAKLGDDPAKK